MSTSRAATRTGVFSVLLFLLAFAPDALADPLPPGTYQQSCRAMAANGGTLTAECKNRDGDWRGASLANISGCRGDISNQAGVLRCDRGAAPPPGPYQNSCRDFWMDGSLLHASCKDIHGTWHDTMLDVNGCTRQAENIDGMLSCPRGNAPGGSYMESCRQIAVSGKQLNAQCRTRAGGYVPASFDLTRACVGGIYNVDGKLTCVRGGNAPPGSYEKSCIQIEVNGANISAQCRTNNGAWNSTSLVNARACTGDINNNDGKLQCGASAAVPPPPVEDKVQCCNVPVPAGFIMVDHKYNAGISHCGTLTASSNMPNQCFYRRYDNQPQGVRLAVCSAAATPAGWKDLGAYEDIMTCATGRLSNAKNMKGIERLPAGVGTAASPMKAEQRIKVQPELRVRGIERTQPAIAK